MEYEYKYLAIDQQGAHVYDPKMVYSSQRDSSFLRVWRLLRVASEAHPRAVDRETEVGADHGNLLHLHSQGWEPSHVVPQISSQGFIVVLRRKV